MWNRHFTNLTKAKVDLWKNNHQIDKSLAKKWKKGKKEIKIINISYKREIINHTDIKL